MDSEQYQFAASPIKQISEINNENHKCHKNAFLLIFFYQSLTVAFLFVLALPKLKNLNLEIKIGRKITKTADKPNPSFLLFVEKFQSFPFHGSSPMSVSGIASYHHLLLLPIALGVLLSGATPLEWVSTLFKTSATKAQTENRHVFGGR